MKIKNKSIMQYKVGIQIIRNIEWDIYNVVQSCID